ncbi:MAG: serine acetyltransferase [Verrucomicrobia bacterium]|nr:MAG: serine acetyltransferase [Verrucomicrobiota bacterium]
MTLDELKTALLRSYQEYGGINHLDGAHLPSEESVHRLAYDMMHLLFPGFFEQSAMTMREIPEVTERRLAAVFDRLEAEIEKAMRFVDHPDPVSTAEQKAAALCDAFPEIRRIIQTDVEAAYQGDPAARSIEEIILAYPCVLAISLQRIAHELYRLDVPLIPRMLTEYAHERTGADIHPGANIGTHFFIDHCTGVVIGETAELGHHVKIYQGVTLGAKSFELDDHGHPVKGVKRHPNIEDHVTIYPGATILGGRTTIGRHSTIGSNVWLMKSVAPDSIVYYKGDTTSVVRENHTTDRGETDSGSDDVTDWMI